MTTAYRPYWKSASSKPLWDEDPGEKPARCICTECPHCLWQPCDECSICLPCSENADCPPEQGEVHCCTPKFVTVSFYGVEGNLDCKECCEDRFLDDRDLTGVNGRDFTVFQSTACTWEGYVEGITYRNYGWGGYPPGVICVVDGYQSEHIYTDFYLEVSLTGSGHYNVVLSALRADGKVKTILFSGEDDLDVRAASPSPCLVGINEGVTVPNGDTISCTCIGGDPYDDPDVDYVSRSGEARVKPCGGHPASSPHSNLLCPAPRGCQGSCCTAEIMEVVFSDVDASYCSADPALACRDHDGFNYKVDNAAGGVSIDGGHTVTNSSGSPCVWTGTITGGLVIDTYGSNCVSKTGDVTEDVLVTLTKTATGWTVDATSVTNTIPIFEGVDTGGSPLDCGSAHFRENEHAHPCLAGYAEAASSGAASASTCP